MGIFTKYAEFKVKRTLKKRERQFEKTTNTNIISGIAIITTKNVINLKKNVPSYKLSGNNFTVSTSSGFIVAVFDFLHVLHPITLILL